MINKLQLYLYRLRPINLEPTNIRINETFYKEELRSNVSGTVVFGYGRLFYFMSCRKYDIGAPILFSKEKEERKLLLGRIKEIKKIEINGIIAHKPYCYPFFFFDLSIKRDESSIMLRKIDCNGERAITHFEVLKVFNNYLGV